MALRIALVYLLQLLNYINATVPVVISTLPMSEKLYLLLLLFVEAISSCFLQMMNFQQLNCKILLTRTIKLVGQFPSRNGALEEWNNLSLEIIQKSYSHFHLADHRNAYAWKKGLNASGFCTRWFYEELSGGSKFYGVSSTDLLLIQTFTQ